jgi:hypothetical protein
VLTTERLIFLPQHLNLGLGGADEYIEISKICSTKKAWTIANGLNRMAIILSQDFFTQVSVEQLIEDVKDDSFLIRYFSDKEEART